MYQSQMHVHVSGIPDSGLRNLLSYNLHHHHRLDRYIRCPKMYRRCHLLLIPRFASSASITVCAITHGSPSSAVTSSSVLAFTYFITNISIIIIQHFPAPSHDPDHFPGPSSVPPKIPSSSYLRISFLNLLYLILTLNLFYYVSRTRPDTFTLYYLKIHNASLLHTTLLKCHRKRP